MTPQPANHRETINLDPNIPVTVCLKYPQARRVPSRNGERAMFTTQDNRVLFVDLVLARQIEDLNPQPGELLSITKVQRNGKGPITFTVSRVHGQQPNGTFTVPAAGSTVAAPLQNAASAAAAQSSDVGAIARKPMASAALADEANALVDTYAVVLARALAMHEGRVKPDEVRSILLSAYIQRRQLSSVA
jgi:hypothetical protein